MRQRRHRMRKRQRRDSAGEWIKSGAKVTVKAYAKRYGVDMYTAYEDLMAVAFPLPPSAERWAQRPPPTPRRVAEHPTDDVDADWWITLDGRTFFVAGYTSGGAPYGIYEDEMTIRDRPSTNCHAECCDGRFATALD